MTRRIQITLLSLLMSVCAMASETSVKNADGVEIWYDFDSSTKTASVTYKGESNSTFGDEYTGEVVIPSKVTYEGLEYSVTKIGEGAFRTCRSLTSITIPEGVTEIGDDAFRFCSSLTSIKIPEGVTSIGRHAFYYCSSLTNVTIPESVTEIGKWIFSNCSSLTSITLPEGVTSIGYEAFYSCGSLASITIPESVTEIGDRAFYNCSFLTSVTIPESVTSIGKYAFYGCSSLTSVTIPEGVTSIGYEAFDGCSSLTSIDVALDNNSYTSINGVLFSKDKTILIKYPRGKKDVTSYAIPEGVTSIEDYAFLGCSSLTSITLPEGVTEIGNYAFYDCSSLTSITIPEGVTSIGKSAFYYCYSLTSITSKNTTPPTIGDSFTFRDVDKSILVYVPKSSVDAYKSTEYWKDFTNFIGGDYFVDVTAENGTVEGAGAYEENAEATLTATPAEGYEFVQWSDGVTDNSRTIVVVSDMTFTAEFELKEYTLTTEAENGTVEGAGTYKHGDEATLTATPAEGYKFVQWSDGVTDNPRTIVVVSDMTFTAEFELKEYTLTTEAENGTVEGAGTYKHGDEATVTATPAEGYKFVQWSDGVTDNPRTIEVTSDLILTAEFEIDVTPISDIQTSDVNVRLIGNEIAVEGTDDYAVYSISGQNLGKAESVERGIYIVVANGKCCKVIAK